MTNVWTTAPHRSQVLLERVEKIYSDGRWNGRPEIVFWKGHYYVLFRNGAGHVHEDGKIIMLQSTSNQPKGWTESDIFIPVNEDANEAHVLVTPDRLMAYYVMKGHGTPHGKGHRTLVSHTTDGKHWSEPESVYEPDFSFWKPTTHAGVHYVAADIMIGDPRVELLKSQDGINWHRVSTIVNGSYTEVALLFFPDETLLAFIRQGRLMVSHPPYKQWEEFDAPELHGPGAALVGDVILVSGRTFSERFPDDQPGTARTGLFIFDPETRRFHWQMNMVTHCGGDESYPHFWPIDDRRALMVWYSGEPYDRVEPRPADLLLSTLRVCPALDV